MHGTTEQTINRTSFQTNIPRFGWFLAILLATTHLNAEWVAFNDHSPTNNTSLTHPNATTLNCAVNGSTVLKNITNGASLSATLTISTNGTPTLGNQAGVPSSGTPLATTFNGYVYFGSTMNPGSAIQVNTSQTVVYTFSGLDPNKRYIFRGGAVRGSTGYTNRWTLVDLQGVDGATPNHQQGTNSPWGILTSGMSGVNLSAFQTAVLFGDNRWGDMVEWDNINPGIDGIFTITCSQYSGTVPTGHGTNELPCTTGGTYGYAISGIRLEEVDVGGPLAVTVLPANPTVTRCGSITFRASVAGGTSPFIYQWMKDGGDMDGQTAATLVLNGVQDSDAGAYSVRVFDSATPPGLAWSEPASTLTVTPDTSVSTLLSAVGGPDLSTITVSFSKPINVSGPEAMVVQGLDSNTLAVSSATVTNQTNVILTTSSPREGKNYEVVIQAGGVTDACNGSAVATGSSVQILERLTLMPWSYTWRYNQEGVDLGTDWKNYAYADESNWPEGVGVLEAKVPYRATIAGLAVGTVLQLTNANFSADACLPTFYFRTHFNYPANVNPASARLIVRTLFDDAGIVYINGREVWRSTTINATNEPFGSYLNSTIGTPGISTAVTLGVTNLNDGDNVIAVYLKQGDNNSSDITMGLELSTVITNFYVTGGPITFNLNAASTNLPQCGTLNLNAIVQGGTRPYAYQWYRDATALTAGPNVSGATGANLTIVNVQPADAGNYTLQVTDAASVSATSPEIPVTVAAEPTPGIVSAISSTDLHTITANFNTSITISSPSGGDFLVQAEDGSGNLAISTAVVTNGNVVTLVTTDALQQKNYRLVVQGSGVVATCGALRVADGTAQRITARVLIFSLDANNSWQYNGIGVDLGSAWLDNGYDDHNSATGWATGEAVLDAKENPRNSVGGQTVRTQLVLTNSTFTSSNLVIPTYYFRKHFTPPAGLADMSLSCRTFFDDYGIIYLNGQEAYRSTNIVATNELFGTYLQHTVGDASFSPEIGLPKTNCVAGDNVIAIYLKQGSPGSSDITMGLELIATVTNWPAAGPQLSIFNNNDGTVSISWNPAGGTLQQSSDLRSWSDAADQGNGVPRSVWGNVFFRVR